MGLDEQEINERRRPNLTQLEELVREAWDKPWWRRLMTEITNRRTSFLQALVESDTSGLGQRQEDRLRGQINELTFFLALDERGRALVQEGRQDGRQNWAS